MRKKKSIFWDLPYWKDLEVCSVIDMMHMTKNLCVTLLDFLGMYGKTNLGQNVVRQETPPGMYFLTVTLMNEGCS